jgi:tripartite-type tricarboxylate transporter receptor subunit TctC
MLGFARTVGQAERIGTRMHCCYASVATFGCKQSLTLATPRNEGGDMRSLYQCFAGCALLVAFAGLTPVAAAADVYPSKPVRLLVGFPPGGPADIAARILGAGLQEVLKQPMIVDNRTGAGGNIASQYVAKAAPDGYTMLVATASFTLNPILSRNAGYDALKDFVPVALLATQANALAVSMNVPVNTLAELQTLARKETLSFATSGVGTSSHLSAIHLFNVLWKTNATPIPYRGAGPAGVAVASGEPPIGFMTITGVLPLQQRGKLKILAVVSGKRLPGLPNVPTMAELGYPQLTPSWTAVFVPAGTPAALVQKINEAVNRVIATPAYKEKVTQQAMAVADGDTPQQLAEYLKSEVQAWERIVKESGVTVE